MKKFFLLISALVLTTVAASASTMCTQTTLDQYVANYGGSTGCSIGSLTFNMFNYVGTGVTASQITVTPDVTAQGLIGFQFTFGWGAFGAGSTEDSKIGYTASAPTAIISDLHLNFAGVVAANGGFASVGETYCLTGPVATCSNPGNLQVSAPPFKGSDVVFLNAGVQSVSVIKDIQVKGLVAGGQASISEVDNYFSLTGRDDVPEPATLGMMGAGLLGLGLIRRRISSK